MSETFIFDVPIYRTAKASYNEDQKSYIDECLYDYYDYPKPIRSEVVAFHRENPHSKTRYIDSLQKQYGGPWQFNDIIGYIRLYLDGYQVWGQLWYVDVKRVVRKPRHKILICKNAGLGFGIPVDIHPQSSNGEIFSHIMKYLDSVRSYPEFRNRFIDSALLETIGPYVDWKSLINSKLKAVTIIV